jgi:hypothetical protein
MQPSVLPSALPKIVGVFSTPNSLWFSGLINHKFLCPKWSTTEFGTITYTIRQQRGVYAYNHRIDKNRETPQKICNLVAVFEHRAYYIVYS